MSKNYDNWERLVAAVLKRDQIWQLCHQDSISSSLFSDDSSDVGSSFGTSPPPPASLNSFSISRSFKFANPQLRQGDIGTTNIAVLLQDVRVSGQKCLVKGSKAAVKRLPETVTVTEHEFEQQMIALGKCSHENVGQPLAYYFSKKRKLIFYDYYSQGSLFDMLKHGDGSRPDWESRLRIAVGAARGVAHIHTQSGGTLAHGNIKSSNIFLNSQNYGCVSDFGLSGIMEPKETSQMVDVFRFGLLLLMLVTRESPSYEVVQRLRYCFEPYPCDEWGLNWPWTDYGTRETDWKWFELHNHRSLKSFIPSDSHRILVDEVEMEEDERERFPFVDIDLDNLTVGLAQDVAGCKEVHGEEARPAMSDVVLMLQNIPQIRRQYPHLRSL